MHPSAMRLGEVFFQVYGHDRKDPVIVDIGSRNLNGSLRAVAPANCTYIGIDFVKGNGVDIVLDDPYAFPLPGNHADFVVSSSCFEHSQMFWLTFLEAVRILKEDGLIYLNVPSNGVYHPHPFDAWRFYPDSGLALAEWGRRSGYRTVLVESFTNDKEGDIWNDFVAVFAKADATCARYADRIAHAARNPRNVRLYGTSELLNVEKIPQDLRGGKAVPIQKMLELALEHHRAGRSAEAEQICQEALEVAPNNVDALHLLGVIAYQAGKHEIAADLIGEALRFQRSNPRLLNSLGEAYRGLGRLGEAERCYRQALAQKPDFPEAHCHLGMVLLAGGRLTEAANEFDNVITLKPEYPLGFQCELLAALVRARLDVSRGVIPELVSLPDAKPPLVSVVICSATPQKFERVDQDFRRLLGGVPHEIIGIHDARSLAEGYNRGLGRCHGEIVVFSHDDVEIVSPDLAARLLRHFETSDLVGIAGTTRVTTVPWFGAGWPHLCGQCAHPAADGSPVVTVYGIASPLVPGVQAMDGVWFAARRELADRIGFDEATFDGWHGYDFDFTFRAHLAGYRCAVASDLLLIHDSPGKFDPRWLTYAERALAKFRSELPPGAVLPKQPLIHGVTVNSAAEWRLMTQHLITGTGSLNRKMA